MSNKVELDYENCMEEAVKLLKSLGIVSLTIQTFGDNKIAKAHINPKIIHGKIDKFFPKLVEMNKKSSGIFFCPNQTDLKGRKEGNITKVTSVFVDFDGGIELPTFEIKPSVVVRTKNGFHCYWVLEDECTVSEFDSIQLGIIEKYNGDRNAMGVNRVLRLPGFFHLKNPNDPFLVKIIENNSKRYKTKELLEQYGSKKTPGPKEVYVNEFSVNKKQYPLRRWSVIKNNCRALNRVFELSRKDQLGSAEGLSLLSYLQMFKGGRELFIDTTVGWGTDSSELREIDKFIAAGYAPYSCKKLCKLGVCKKEMYMSCDKPFASKGRNISPIQFISKKNISTTIYKSVLNRLRRN